MPPRRHNNNPDTNNNNENGARGGGRGGRGGAHRGRGWGRGSYGHNNHNNNANNTRPQNALPNGNQGAPERTQHKANGGRSKNKKNAATQSVINQLFNTMVLNPTAVANCIADFLAEAERSNGSEYKRQLDDIYKRLDEAIGRDYQTHRGLIQSLVRSAQRLFYVDSLAELFTHYLCSPDITHHLKRSHLDGLDVFATSANSTSISSDTLQRKITELRPFFPANNHNARTNETLARYRYDPEYRSNLPTNFLLPDERNFFRAVAGDVDGLPGVQVDAPIPQQLEYHHYATLFALLREDCTHGFRNAINVMKSVARKWKGPKSDQRLQYFIRESDTERNVRCIFGITYSGVALHPAYGCICTFRLPDENHRHGSQGKFLPGNLIALNPDPFDPHPSWHLGLVVPINQGAPNKKAPVTSFGFSPFVDPPAFRTLCFSATSFVAVESSAFYASYAAALTTLRHLCLHDGHRMLLSAPLFQIQGNEVPPYLEGKDLVIGGLLATRANHSGELDPTSAADWAAACEEWSYDLEQQVRERARRNKEDRNVHVVDATQQAALRHIFSHRVAVVQGTPGTGKSFVAVKAFQILHQNRKRLAEGTGHLGPIVIMALTNHAVDAVLKEIVHFLSGLHSQADCKERILRLGGGTREESLRQYQFPHEVSRGSLELRRFREEFDEIAESDYLRENESTSFHLFLTNARNSVIRSRALPFRFATDAASRQCRELLQRVAQCEDSKNEETVELLCQLFSTPDDVRRDPQTALDAAKRANEGSSCGYPKLRKMWATPRRNKRQVQEDPVHDALWSGNEENLAAPVRHLFAELRQVLGGANNNGDSDGSDEQDDYVDVDRGRRDERAGVMGDATRAIEVVRADDRMVDGVDKFFKDLQRHIHDAESARSVYMNLGAANRDAFLRAAQIQQSHKVNRRVREALEGDGDRILQESRQEVVQKKSRYMRKLWVIAGTVNAVLNESVSLRRANPRVLMVEEAAEVMEGHVLAAVGPSVEHLILIGDHKQLSPKAEVMELRRRNLEVSLQERLVLSGSDFVTLTTQRRMASAISKLIHGYYLTDKNQPVQILDHPSTANIPLPVGVQDDRRLFLVNYDIDAAAGRAEERNELTKSYFNKYEADVMRALVTHILRYNPKKDITVLVAYVQQLLIVTPLLRDISPNVHIRTVDDFQGEESDFVLISTVRTERPGFLNVENRACVALSRARMACYIVGHVPMLQKACNLYQEAVQLMQEADCVGTSFPGYCVRHNYAFEFTTLESYGANCCKARCGDRLPCGHTCSRNCHDPNDNSHKDPCRERCSRVGPQCTPKPRLCDHPCPKLCHQECGPCVVLVDYKCPRCDKTSRVRCSDVMDNPQNIKCGINVTITGDKTLCGHAITAPCHVTRDLDLLAARCQEPCGHHLKCGHICPRTCHASTNPESVAKAHDYQREQCLELRPVQLPCGHTGEKVCNARDDSVRCRLPCEHKLPCGHKCANKRCGHDGPHDCGKSREKTCSTCHRSFNVRCIQYDSAPCPHPCGAELDCGHHCPSTCGACTPAPDKPKWLVHGPCAGRCDARLACGHRCQDGCGTSPCSLCRHSCDFECGHGKPCAARAPHPCGECPSMRCVERCAWSCPHQQCTKRCTEVCDRPVCDELCPKTLPCGHPCHGVCGERCPEHCPTCFAAGTQEKRPHVNDLGMVFAGDAEEEEEFLRTEDVAARGLDLRLVQMPCCGTITPLCVLEGYLASKEGDRQKETGIAVSELVVQCPLTRADGNPCGKPILPTHFRRGSRVILEGYRRLVRFNDKMREDEKKRAAARQEYHTKWVDGVLALLHGDDKAKCVTLREEYDQVCLLIGKEQSQQVKNPKGPQSLLDALQMYDKKLSEKTLKAKTQLFDHIFAAPPNVGPASGRLSERTELMLRALFFDSPALRSQLMVQVPAGEGGKREVKDLLPDTLSLAVRVLIFALTRARNDASLKENYGQLFLAAEKRFVEEAVLAPRKSDLDRETALQSWGVLVQMLELYLAAKVAATDPILPKVRGFRDTFNLKRDYFAPESEASRPDYLRRLQTNSEGILKEGKRVLDIARGHVPDPAFLLQIARAVGLDAGHYYTCPNDHYYLIGDCGGAMVRGRCPECGSEIGGEQHRALATNRFAGNLVQPGTNPAWPQ